MTPTEFIAVMDLEWTSWEGAHARNYSGPGERQEIVQIGILKLADTVDLPTVDSLEILVKPRFNPLLSDYFIDLTGITQERVDQFGVPFAEALDRLQAFVGDDTGAVCCYGRDGDVVRMNCGYYGLSCPFGDSLFQDVRETICRYLHAPVDRYYSSDLWRPFGFADPGASHTTLNDCQNVVEALRIMRRAGEF